MNLLKNLFLSLVILTHAALISNAQDPNRFKQQVDELAQREIKAGDKKLAVFAGSSSIRMWNDIQDYFPGYHVINNGFGGSHFSDLLYFYGELILKPKPEILLIYEGDNDIASNKKTRTIINEVKELTAKIKCDLPGTKIIFISPKPSIARVHLKNEYIRFNKKLKNYCNRQENVQYADVWSPMLDKKGNVFKDIFIEDGLHMNKKGYDIWGKVIGEILKD